MREMWFAPLLVLLLALAPPVVAQPGASGGKPAAAPTASEQDRVLGKAGAPITIIEYASLTCPHCAHFADDVLPHLKQKWIDTGKAKLILRDFPLDEAALRAAMVARCVPPDRFYPLVDTFFASQDKWVVAKDWQDALQHIAQLAGVSKKKFDSCIADKKLEDEVAQSRLTAATQYGVAATPTFFVNGTKFEGEPTVEKFDQLLSGLAAKS
ncbi:MAG: DsbA family protein [Thiohalocapsa sp.]